METDPRAVPQGRCEGIAKRADAFGHRDDVDVVESREDCVVLHLFYVPLLCSIALPGFIACCVLLLLPCVQRLLRGFTAFAVCRCPYPVSSVCCVWFCFFTLCTTVAVWHCPYTDTVYIFCFSALLLTAGVSATRVPVQLRPTVRGPRSRRTKQRPTVRRQGARASRAVGHLRAQWWGGAHGERPRRRAGQRQPGGRTSAQPKR